MSDSIVVQVHSPVETGKVDEESKSSTACSAARDEMVAKVVASVKAKIDQGRLEEGSSKAIRKAMEKAQAFLVKGAEKKEIVLASLKLLAAHAPEKWRSTLEVAPTQVDELFKLAQGLSTLNANSTLKDVADQLEAIATSKTMSSCLPCFGSKKKSSK